jgi:hypothetical protein
MLGQLPLFFIARITRKKSQNSNTKLQINLKIQIPMTKTFIIIISHRRANPRLSMMKPMRTTDDEFFVSESGFRLIYSNPIMLA